MAVSVGASSSQSTNSGNNTSAVYGNGSVTLTVGYFSGLQSYGRVWIGGVPYDTAGPTAMNQGDSWGWSAGRGYEHDINGYRGDVGVSVEFWVDGTTLHRGSAGAATQGAINFDRRPAGISGVSAVANADKSVTVSFSGGGSPGGNPALSSTYHVALSKNGAAFTGDYTGSSSPITIPSSAISPGSNYVFRVWATNQSNDGAGASADSASIFVTAGGRIYNGTAWVPTVTARIYNGTAWVPIATARIYDGTTWRNMT